MISKSEKRVEMVDNEVREYIQSHRESGMEEEGISVPLPMFCCSLIGDWRTTKSVASACDR